MNRFTGGAVSLLASFVLALSGAAAWAQSADGLLDTLKGVVSDPIFGSFLMSKIGSPSSIMGRSDEQPSDQGSPLGSGNGYLMPNSYAGIGQLPSFPGSFAYNGYTSPLNSGRLGTARDGNQADLASNGYGNPLKAWRLGSEEQANQNGSMHDNNGYLQSAPGFSSAQQENYGAITPSSNSYGFNRPPSGFYSLEQGAGLGGIGYNPAMFGSMSSPSTYGQPVRKQTFAPDNSATPIAYYQPSLPQMPVMSNHMFSPNQETNYDPSNSQITITNRIAPAELRQLSRFDISVLIDKSGSMSTRDCPNQFALGHNISRWEWCREQSTMLAQQTEGALPAGITIVPFAGNWQRFSNITQAGINGIFSSVSPDGSTNLAAALKSELDRYFQERDAGSRQRPLMIAVITNGVPESKSAVRRVIREATEHMTQPNEIKIVFFVIGQDKSGAEFVDELTDRLASEGAVFQIVSEHSFAEVTRVGLTRSLASAAFH